MDVADLTEKQLSSFSIIERVCSVLSLLGSILVIVTFSTSKSFHKPINRLVFYASFGNMMTNVATLMARSYLGDANSAGCQFQAFLIQMFMPADAFWTLAMAINVHLTFYYKFDSRKLRRMEVPYLLCCYGVPFIVALTYIFVNDRSPGGRGRMYGNATLWCWVSPGWDIWRIATFYGPVWVVILITIFIYGRAGREIYKKHKQLRDFSSYSHHDPEPLPPMDDLFSSNKTTEISVTTETIHQQGIDLTPLGRRGQAQGAVIEEPAQPNPAYTVTISANRRDPDRESYHQDMILPIQNNNVTIDTGAGLPASKNPTGRLRRRQAYEASNATWSYTKCAILFFTAMLVTWIPSSANRVFSVVHVNRVSLALEYMSAFVLPLQGFWNAIIYCVTSWKACKMFLTDILYASRRPRMQDIMGFSPADEFQRASSAVRQKATGGAGMGGGGGGGGGRVEKKDYESESMTELATNTRSNSHERS